MNVEQYAKFVASKVRQYVEDAKILVDEGEDATELIGQLNTFADTLERGEGVPAGFENREQYDAFLTEQGFPEVDPDAEELDDEEYGPAARPDSVFGADVDENGELKEYGGQDDIARANALVEDDEYGDDEEEDVPNTFRITYTRLDGKALEDGDIHYILDEPATARTLRVLGDYHLTGIAEGETPAEKVATFDLDGQGDLDLRTLAYGIAQYRGIRKFAGLGRIQAVGAVV